MLTAPLVLATVLAAAPAQAADRGDEETARLLGALLDTHVSAQLDGVPAAAAIEAISTAIGEPIIGRFTDEHHASGIDPALPLTLATDDADALDVLEMVLDQCATFEPCTWQIRRGYVEVGTKDRLSTPAASVRRVVSVRDLLLEPPYFASPAGGPVASVAEFDKLEYSTAALSRPTDEGRKRPEVLLLEIVHGIVELVEPGNWDYGQFDDEGDEYDDPWARNQKHVVLPAAHYAAPPPKIARIRCTNGALIVVAPDFVQRQIFGYPRPIAPPPLTADERAARSRAASAANGCTIVVLARPTLTSGSGGRP